jgi:hypothetical protein
LIKVERINVYNFENALRGMRNPMNSWDKSDSKWFYDGFEIGENDLRLALNLVKSGTDHSKFMRQILVSMDITAPSYWWREMDTYKVATVANSTSTMHTLTSKPLTLDDFSWDRLSEPREKMLEHLNSLIEYYKATNDKEVWRELIQDLPGSYNYLRTWTANYQVLRNIYFARRNHKHVEWRDFCKMIEGLPYGELITIEK